MDSHIKTDAVKETLSKSDIHDGWEDDYRNPENERFYDMAFDLIAKVVGNPGSGFLDIGCGSCAHSKRLAERGYTVCAIDFSEPVVENARRNVADAGLQDKIEVVREDVLALTFEDGKFDNVLCWGVLMHIPEAENAISELDRVLRKGGKLVFSENNAYSVHSVVLRGLKKVFGKGKAKSKWTPAGMENWENTDAGELMTRQANMKWLQQNLRDRGYVITKRASGELTELYTRLPSRGLKKLVHKLNRFWFRYVGLPQPALCNILIAEKT